MKPSATTRFNAYQKRLLKDLADLQNRSNMDVQIFLDKVIARVKDQSLTLKQTSFVAYIIERGISEDKDKAWQERMVTQRCAHLANELGIRF